MSLLLLGAGQRSSAQTGAERLRTYRTTIAALNAVDYQVERNDTFGEGDVWHHTGQVMLQRNPKSRLLGVSFFAHRPDIGASYYYNGNVGFDLDDKVKTFQIVKEPYAPSVLGSPAGQMLVEELLAIDTTYQSVTYSTSPQGGVLHLRYPDQPTVDVLNRSTDLFLDGTTGLVRIVRTSMVRGGRPWITRKLLTKVQLNAAAQTQVLQAPAFLTEYSPVVPAPAPVAAPSLLGRAAPPFQLVSFTKAPIKLQAYRGKVVVLDFWETFCAPCIASMPKLQHMQDTYPSQVVVMGVLLDSSKEAILRAAGILHRQRATYLQVMGTPAQQTAYHVTGFPHYVVIGKDGKVVLDKEGGSNMQAVAAAIKRAVAN
ncbi:TlpA family protein disulfide reductase [Hymenobacter sp. BRD67]|uniref:TlpA family protein disulfide reductase n=1 Tax=Hymenobacter sp. BRD67 TaxID=2675877 RepID=UPI001564C0DE|nr:TlpA disulfide reductase family protein [Hymenobacter sp. BRD67]QKG53614.1 TlpA family protein disulfide reductase [Hymenobacter sp. BRD67]